MIIACYLRNRIVYLPTNAKTEAGYYMHQDPVLVIPASNTDGLRRALTEMTAKGNPIIPTPTRATFPPPVLPKYAGVKSSAAFARGASRWSIEERKGVFQIIGCEALGRGAWREDPEQKTDFLPGTSVEVVIDRMIAILQDAAQN